MTARAPGTPGILRLAHRGDWRRAPENSIEALVAALDVPGCDGVEFDVRLSRDGVPVLLHDRSLARVQGSPQHVDELSAAELADHGIPELEAVLRVLPPRAFMDVELKGDDHGAVTAEVLRAARGDAPARAVISSFEGPTLVAMADRLPEWARWLNAEDLDAPTVSLAVGLGCRAVSVLWGSITPATMRMARASGLDVGAWTVRRRATLERLERLGVRAACVEGAALDGSGGRG